MRSPNSPLHFVMAALAAVGLLALAAAPATAGGFKPGSLLYVPGPAAGALHCYGRERLGRYCNAVRHYWQLYRDGADINTANALAGRQVKKGAFGKSPKHAGKFGKRGGFKGGSFKKGGFH